MCSSIPREQLHPSLSSFFRPSLSFPFILQTSFPWRTSLSDSHLLLTPVLFIPFPLVLHAFVDHLVPFCLFSSSSSFFTVRTSTRDSTHAFNLGGREPRSAASLQLRNFPPSLRSPHTLGGRQRCGATSSPDGPPTPFLHIHVCSANGHQMKVTERSPKQ